MKDKSTNPTSIADNLLWIGIGLAAVFWIAESAIHVFIFHEGELIQQIFNLQPHETWMRLIVVAMFIAFAIYAQFIITRRKRAEQATKHAYAELNQIFNTAADGMRVVDKEFNLLKVNETFSNLSGVSKDEAVGRKCYDVFPGPLCHTPECPLVRILSGEERVEYDAERVRNDGVTVPCIVTATPFVEPGGELVGIVENFKDITKRKQAEKALQKAHDNLEQRVRERTTELVSANEQLKREIEERERAEKARRETEGRLYQKQKRIEMFEFTNALSLKLMDELRNPLVAVGGFAARISSGDYPEDKLREYTGVIFKESKRLDNVLEEVVTHLKATAEQV